MKRIYTTLLLAAITLFACQTVSAYDFEVGGIYYNLNTSDMTATVTFGDEKYAGDVVIPSSVTYNTKTLKVTKIGGYAFFYCTSLTSITIPNSVTTIGGHAFEDCTSLSSVTIPNSVTTIGEWAFLRCTSLSSVTIPNSVTTIGYGSFKGCTSLSSITIPNSVTKIGSKAFSGCTSLSTVALSENLTEIAQGTFQGCSQLTSVSIPAHIIDIESSSFFKCENLEKLIFEDSDQPLKIYGEKYGKEASCLYPTYLYLGRNVEFENEYNFIFSYNIKTLVIGSTYMSSQYPTSTKTKTIISRIEKPNRISHFPGSVYVNATLYVPKGTKALYESTDGWKQFFTIQEGDPMTGIVSTKDDVDKVEVSRYDVKGQRLNAPRKGINIVRYSDGTTEKIVVR
ncbi:leucine rich repeat protein [Prevotella sp. MSX73]|nr:leucine rich repeat protein [Prevotella sp. MSX73]